MHCRLSFHLSPAFVCSLFVCSHAPTNSPVNNNTDNSKIVHITFNITNIDNRSTSSTVNNVASTKVASSNDSDGNGGDVREAKDNSSVPAKMRRSSDKDPRVEDLEDRKQPAKVGISLSFKAGPRNGEVLNMIKGENETVIFGSNPARNANASAFKIEDDTLGISHVKLQIVRCHKKCWRVQVTDLKPNKGGTTIGRIGPIPKGKSFEATPGQTIHFGKSQVLVLKYTGA
jgi:hypothetical protein